jgi:hypothetical protein
MHLKKNEANWIFEGAKTYEVKLVWVEVKQEVVKKTHP